MITVSSRNSLIMKEAASREYQEINYISKDWSGYVSCYVTGYKYRPLKTSFGYSHSHTCVLNFHIDIFSSSQQKTVMILIPFSSILYLCTTYHGNFFRPLKHAYAKQKIGIISSFTLITSGYLSYFLIRYLNHAIARLFCAFGHLIHKNPSVF